MIKIDRVVVGYNIEGERKAITLTGLRKHCRPERLEDLIEDLELLVGDVEAGRRPEDRGRPPLSLVRQPI